MRPVGKPNTDPWIPDGIEILTSNWQWDYMCWLKGVSDPFHFTGVSISTAAVVAAVEVKYFRTHFWLLWRIEEGQELSRIRCWGKKLQSLTLTQIGLMILYLHRETAHHPLPLPRWLQSLSLPKPSEHRLLTVNLRSLRLTVNPLFHQGKPSPILFDLLIHLPLRYSLCTIYVCIHISITFLRLVFVHFFGIHVESWYAFWL